MTGIILAAGKGTRLGLDIPKPLVEVAGKSIISYVIDGMYKAEVSRIIVVVGHQGDMIREHVGSHIQCVPQFVHEYGTAAALRSALFYVDDPMVLVAFGDILVWPDVIYRQVANGFQSQHGAIAIDRITTALTEKKGVISQNQNTTLHRIDKKQTKIGMFNNTGIFAFWKGILCEGVNSVRRNTEGEYDMTRALNYIARKGDINCVEHTGAIFDIGTPDKLAEADTFMRRENGLL